MRLLLLGFLPLLTVAGLSLTSHCTQSKNECRCSQHSSPPFCLSSTTSTTCRQHKCHSRYVCDCSGTTLCRITNRRTVLTCTQQVTEGGLCQCRRDSLREPAMTLVPLREYGPIRQLSQNLCSEPPAYWADEGRGVLRGLWDVLTDSTEARIDRVPERTALSFGHAGHAVSFTNPNTFSSAMISHIHSPMPLETHFIDPTHSLDSLTAECAAAHVTIRLMERGIATRLYAHVQKFDVQRLLMQRCSLLHAEHPMIGMNVKRVLEIANMATGEFSGDDTGISQIHVQQACRALNRNFEGCQVDLGCVAVAG